MLDVAYIIRTRERKERIARRSPWGKIGLGCALLLSMTIALAGVLFGIAYIELTRDLPPVEAMPLLVDQPDGLLYQPSRLYDRTGEHILFSLENPAIVDRQYLTLDSSQSNHIPSNLITATLAISDPDFWQHPGFTLESISTRTSPAMVPPSLAQRLVSELLLWDEPPGLRRFFHEHLLAAQITARYGRERVLTWYLNTANYGRLAFGAEAAAQVYFGKPAAELTLAEAAMLAAVAETPALNPLDAPQAALERQQAALQTMINQGAISTQQWEEAREQDLKFRSSVPLADNLAPAYARLVLDQLDKRIDLARLERGGYKVITSLDYDLQSQASCAADALTARLAGSPEVLQTADGSECLTARLLPTITQKNGSPMNDLVANVIVFDPNQGEVLAMIGETVSGQDPAQEPGSSPGTILSPIVYLTAFTRGLSPATLLWDIPTSSETIETDITYQGPVRLRTALANDYQPPLQNVITQVGIANVWRTIQQLGLASGEAIPQNAPELYDQFQASLLDLSQAYAIFAAQGILAGEQTTTSNETSIANGASGTNGISAMQPVTILRLEDYLGRSWSGQYTPIGNIEFSQRSVIIPQLAYLISDVLSDEIARWPTLGHPNPLEIGRPVAAKIGSTAEGKDAWTIGYTPERLVGVRLGVQGDEQPNQDIARQSAALWNAIMQYVLQDIPIQYWPVPSGVSRLNVCNPSGLLPSEDCPDIVSEVFLAGTEPTQPDTLYQTFQINRETGRLATAFTPPELIDERVYLIVPSEAEEWARLAGLPTPPEEYDVILAPSSTTSDVQITNPAMFSPVSGVVELEGRATGDNFAFYRLQVGSGLNPRTWLQIEEDNNQPVRGGLLGTWDASELEGLQTIQLQVVRNDQRVDTTVLQVTVDNQPPQVSILSPLEGQAAIPRAGQVTLLADAQDNLESDRVEFYVDGVLVDTRYQEPYAIPWQSKPGKHSLRVVAVDRAGNQSETTIEFTVNP